MKANVFRLYTALVFSVVACSGGNDSPTVSAGTAPALGSSITSYSTNFSSTENHLYFMDISGF